MWYILAWLSGTQGHTIQPQEGLARRFILIRHPWRTQSTRLISYVNRSTRLQGDGIALVEGLADIAQAASGHTEVLAMGDHALSIRRL
jgi:hypothetical protein